MYDSDNGNEVLRCPYNKCHFVPRSRFQRHLVKCEKNYPPNYKVVCPYNATHRLSKSEIEEHINKCPMRNTVEASYFQSPSNYNVIKFSKGYESTSETNSNVAWESKEEMTNLSGTSLNSKLRDQINKSIEGKVESFIKSMNIEQGSSHHYEYYDTESIGADVQSIDSIIVSSRRDIFNNAEYYRRFRMRGGKK